MGEALAHLHALYYEGKLVCRVGDDGNFLLWIRVMWYYGPGAFITVL